MSGQYSIDALRDFLDWAADKGAIKRATALSWRTAVDKVFADPDGIDTGDLRGLQQNLDEMLRRFANLHAKDYTSASLRTYQGRVRSALKEFLRYADDPAHYSPRIARRSSGRMGASKDDAALDDRTASRAAGGSNYSAENTRNVAPPGALTIPIPIREGIMVQIHGLPADLTSTEADKVANVVKAYATLDK